LEKNLGYSRIWKTSWTCTVSSGKQISRRRSLQRWLERCQAKQTKEKEKIVKEIITIQVADAVALARAIMTEKDAEDAEEAEEEAEEEKKTIVSIWKNIWKMLNVSIVANRGHYSTDCSAPRKNYNEHSNMVSKADFKNLFKSSLKDMFTKKDKQSKKQENTEGDDESLDMNVFEKLMEGKHIKIVHKGDDDLISINDTDTFAYSKHNNMTDKSCLDNN
jgi:hypothetical protein